MSAPNAVDIHVGTRLRMQRVLLGWSQEKLGIALNVTFQQIQKYENGVNRVSASRLYQAAQLLGVPVQFFYDGLLSRVENKEGDSGEFSITKFMGSIEGLQLNRAFCKIRGPLRKNILDLIKVVSAS